MSSCIPIFSQLDAVVNGTTAVSDRTLMYERVGGVPNALGALCLNPEGLAMVLEWRRVRSDGLCRRGIGPMTCICLTAPFASQMQKSTLLTRFVSALLGRDMQDDVSGAGMLGMATDELMRHHEQLREVRG